MKKLLLSAIVFVLIFAGMPVFSQSTYFSRFEVTDVKNGTAKLKWYTAQEPTKAFIYFGEIAEDLTRTAGYGAYDFSHEVLLYELQKDTTYYYKIVAYNKFQQKTESFVQVFSTGGMKDTVYPEFVGQRVLQTTRDAAVISWETNELTRAAVQYGYYKDSLGGRASYKAFHKYHEMFLYKLYPYSKYYVKIIAEDQGGNKKISFLEFRTGGIIKGNIELQIYDIRPVASDPGYVTNNSATIKWKTNLAAKSRLHLGTTQGKYDKRIDVNIEKRSLDHQITLTDIESNKTYYYKIEAFGGLYNKGKITNEMTFTTSSAEPYGPQVEERKDTVADFFDHDQDGLSDNYELEIGTDPFLFDSDGDSYGDGNEMKYGYDPLIPGSTLESRLKPERYLRPKLSGAYEEQKINELKAFIHRQIGYTRVSDSNWTILTNAYIYGKYPGVAITQAMRFGGKTVHPTISWMAWQNSSQYKEYIDR